MPLDECCACPSNQDDRQRACDRCPGIQPSSATTRLQSFLGPRMAATGNGGLLFLSRLLRSVGARTRQLRKMMFAGLNYAAMHAFFFGVMLVLHAVRHQTNCTHAHAHKLWLVGQQKVLPVLTAKCVFVVVWFHCQKTTEEKRGKR